MLNRAEKVLKAAILLFAAFLALQVAHVVSRTLPLNRLAVPAVPALAVAPSTTNAPAKPSENKGTNSVTIAKTNSATNLVANSGSTTNQTNSLSASKLSATNSLTLSESQKADTNGHGSVAVTTTNTSKSTVVAGTNSASTNVAGEKSDKKGTNSPAIAGAAPKPGVPPRRGELAGKSPDVPPPIKARIDRITQSEILGMVPHPLPMGLLGIAGDRAFIRSPEGQTAMVQVGSNVGTLKLLQIGTNRVLVEHEGQKKELMIFSGFGGETLAPKEEKKPDETTKKTTK